MTGDRAAAVYGAVLAAPREGDPADTRGLAQYMSGMELALELQNRHPVAGRRLLEAFRLISHADEAPGAAHAHMQGARYLAKAIDEVTGEIVNA